MDFGTNLTPIEVFKKGAFGRTYFRDICFSVNDRWYKDSWKEFKDLKILIVSIIVVIVMMLI